MFDRLVEARDWLRSHFDHDYLVWWGMAMLALGTAFYAMYGSYPIMQAAAGGFMVTRSWWLGKVKRGALVKPTTDPYEASEPVKSREKGKDEPDEAKFCADCGTRFVPWKRQDGFHPETGLPRYRAHMACPQWDPDLDEKARHAYYTLPGPAAMLLGYRSTYTCGKKVTSAEKPDIHNHRLTGVVESTCPGCIEDMVKIGSLTRDEANQLLKMLA